MEKVERYETEVYYRTNGGIVSYYSIKAPNRFVMGTESAKDDFKEDTTAIEYYDRWSQNRNALRQPDGDISHLPADISITNKNTLILMPTRGANDGFERESFDELRNMIRESGKVSDGHIEWEDTPTEFMDALINHELVGYGAIYFCGHGGIDEAGNYTMNVFNDPDVSDWESFERRYANLISSVYDADDQDTLRNCTWNIEYGMIEEEVVDAVNNATRLEVRHYAILSSRYIMQLYRDYNFDNAFIVMVSCHGLGDDTFNSFLVERNAQALIGSELSIRFGTIENVFETVLSAMYNNADNEASKLSNAWNANITDGATNAQFSSFEENEGEVVTVQEYWNEYRRQALTQSYTPEQQREKQTAILANFNSNNNITSAELIREYLMWTDSTLFDIQITVYAEDTTNTSGRNRRAGTFDYTCKCNDRLQYITDSTGDIAFGGSGEISGTLYKGKTVRTIKADGSYSDAPVEEDVLKNAKLVAKRFLNQSFVDIAETTSGSDGKFTFKSNGEEIFPWGHYVIAADYSSYDGETSIILSENSTDGGKFVLNGGKSKISGYVQGRKSLEDKTLIDLEDATVTLTLLSSGERKSAVVTTAEKKAKTDSSGYFEFKDLAEGEYTITISKDEYETLTGNKAVEAGYEYNYEKGYFVLQTDDSTKEVVLVLDNSGSMEGAPIESLRAATKKFAENVIKSDSGYSVSIVNYSDGATTAVERTKYYQTVLGAVDTISAGNGTNMDAGICEAERILNNSDTERKIIVIMSDGAPNSGRCGDELVDYVNGLKDSGITVYTIGFFSNMDESSKNECRSLMRRLASYAYHYEADSDASLVEWFNDMAKQVNEVPVVYVEIACPVDVSVTYNGETLSSAPDNQNFRTSFGTLMLDGDEYDPSKILRLYEGVEYEIKIEGTGEGTMDYKISYVDENGEYTDTRNFDDIEINEKFMATTTVARDDHTVMEIDEDGDGIIDDVLEYKIEKEEVEEEEEEGLPLIWIVLGVVVVGAVIFFMMKSKKKTDTTATAKPVETTKPADSEDSKTEE